MTIKPKTPKAPKEFTAEVRDLVAKRSQLRCEGCGGGGPLQLHHRLYKSRGGRGTVENAIALCGMGNASRCHGAAHSLEGEQLGWSIRSGFDPAEVPAQLFLYGMRLLTPDGGVSQNERRKETHENPQHET